MLGPRWPSGDAPLVTLRPFGVGPGCGVAAVGDRGWRGPEGEDPVMPKRARARGRSTRRASSRNLFPQKLDLAPPLSAELRARRRAIRCRHGGTRQRHLER
jgi:hypothetical protein